MNSQLAVQYYKGQEKYNCAQSVIRAFYDVVDTNLLAVEGFKKYGGGRAEGGLCGALYAAKRIMGDDERAQKVESLFAEEVGDVVCYSIRQTKHVSCVACVEIAAKIVESMFDSESNRDVG